MDDIISRQAALDAITEESILENMDSVYDTELKRCKRAVHRIIAKLPSAQPERKPGHWMWEGFNIVCSKCDAMPIFDSTEPLYRFCPNCGAEMKGDNDD